MYGIIVGFDEAPTTEPALEWAFDEAESRRLPLTVVTVVSGLADPAPGRAYQYPATERELEQARSSAADAVEKLLARRGSYSDVRYEVKAESGLAADVLLRYASDAQQIVVGSRGHGGFSRLLLGSVSTAMVHHAPCPVTVVPTNRPQHHDA